MRCTCGNIEIVDIQPAFETKGKCIECLDRKTPAQQKLDDIASIVHLIKNGRNGVVTQSARRGAKILISSPPYERERAAGRHVTKKEILDLINGLV